jgi:hypothetical protein
MTTITSSHGRLLSPYRIEEASMSFLEWLRNIVNAGLDRASVLFFEHEGIVVWSFRRLLQTPQERLARPHRTYKPKNSRSPEEAFSDRTFAALFGVVLALSATTWVLAIVRLLF